MSSTKNEQFLTGSVFLAGLGSGVTEAVLVVTPTEMCKVRMQAEIAPAATVFTATLSGRGAPATTAAAVSKYENVLQTAALVAREEGLGALYKGLVPTVLRQGCNQVITSINQCEWWKLGYLPSGQ